MAKKKQINQQKKPSKNKMADIQNQNVSEKTINIPIQSQKNSKFPIVGIGASAGGLAAFEAFFSGMPGDIDALGKSSENPGMAFVLIQHLAPDHKSILTELIKKYTKMHVYEVEDGMIVQPNCVYIIPPGRDMAILNGILELLEPISPHGQRLPIDFFFRSLALDQRELAICIVLSGTGSDGTLGARAIKDAGGMVMVQNPESTEYDGMPTSVIATGLVDYELPASEMVAQIISYLSLAFGKRSMHTSTDPAKSGDDLKKLFILLRSQTGHDFSLYKPTTINRRVERRMAVAQIERIDNYIKHAQQTPSEVEALFRDLLIGVTNFFRDPEAFKSIDETVIPQLFKNKDASESVRIWVPGCSTGEEAYSLAILLAENMEMLKQNYSVQIFATDIDDIAINFARIGLYPVSISENISSERLARFFTIEPGGIMYRINKSIRDMLVFSEQDLVKDPPFSKLDLISCRNLLIYMGTELQKKIIPLFHYSLLPGGYLFLGSSESVGEFETLFESQNRKQKIYIRKDDYRSTRQVLMNRNIPLIASPANIEKAGSSDKQLPLQEIVEQTLLNQIAPAAILVNKSGDILYLHGRTGLFLEPAPGVSGVSNIVKMARKGLRRELSTTLHKAAINHEIHCCNELRVKTNGDYSSVDLKICPVAVKSVISSESFLYLVILELSPIDKFKKDPLSLDPVPVDKSKISSLEQELKANQEYLQSTQEELETANEELKSSNEEMQSVNEELQSTNEELETSKEELQSVNEELSTVNTELQSKVSDLSRSNNDMNNLLAGTGIGTVFVDHYMHILRFTPAITKIINLIHSDVGRPVSHILSNLKNYRNLISDIQEVLDTLIYKEFDVETNMGSWFNMLIQPYRTLDNVIEGAVITFVDISGRKEVEEQFIKSQIRYRSLFNSMSEMFLILELIYDSKGKPIDYYYRDVNPSFEKLVGKTSEQLLNNRAKRICTIIEDYWFEVYAKVDKTGNSVTFENYGAEYDKYYHINAWKTDNNLIAVSFTDITVQKRIEKELEKTKLLLKQAESRLGDDEDV